MKSSAVASVATKMMMGLVPHAGTLVCGISAPASAVSDGSPARPGGCSHGLPAGRNPVWAGMQFIKGWRIRPPYRVCQQRCAFPAGLCRIASYAEVAAMPGRYP